MEWTTQTFFFFGGGEYKCIMGKHVSCEANCAYHLPNIVLLLIKISHVQHNMCFDVVNVKCFDKVNDNCFDEVIMFCEG